MMREDFVFVFSRHANLSFSSSFLSWPRLIIFLILLFRHYYFLFFRLSSCLLFFPCLFFLLIHPPHHFPSLLLLLHPILLLLLSLPVASSSCCELQRPKTDDKPSEARGFRHISPSEQVDKRDRGRIIAASEK